MFRVSLAALILLMLVAYVSTKYALWDSTSDRETYQQVNEKHAVPSDKRVVSPPSEATLDHATKFVQVYPSPDWATLEYWVYHGNDEQRSDALNYLGEFSVKAVPLILFILYSDADLAVKESALLTLSGLPREIGEPILLNLLNEPQLFNSVIALTDVRPFSPYDRRLEDDEALRNDKHTRLIRSLETLAASTIEEASDTIEMSIRPGIPDEIQLRAYRAAMAVLPEKALHWRSLALQHGNEALLLNVIKELDPNADHAALLPYLLRLVYDESSQSVKTAVSTYLNESTLVVSSFPYEHD